MATRVVQSTRRRLSTVAIVGSLVSGLFVGTPAFAADAPDVSSGLVAFYPLDEATGTVAHDVSGNGRNGTAVGGFRWAGDEGIELTGAGGYVDLPDNLLAGLGSVTVSLDVRIDAAQASPYMIYALGNTTGIDGNGYLFATGDRLRTAITGGNWQSERSTPQDSVGNLPRGVWRNLTYTQTGTTGVFYVDGLEVGRNTAAAPTPGGIGNGVTTADYIGRSVYTNDRYLDGNVRDFRVYDRALDAAQVAEVARTVTQATAAADRDTLTLGDLSRVIAPLTLPTKGVGGSGISWTSSDPAVIATDGTVTRGQADTAVTLTAVVRSGAAAVTRTFTAMVPRTGGAASDRADRILSVIAIPDVDDIRLNRTLPTVSAGSSITWTSSNPAVLSSTGVVTRPAAGAAAVQVTLTAAVDVGGTSFTRDFPATVRPLPPTEETYGYLMAHFVEDANGYAEKIYFDLARGNDPTVWDTLNDGKPVLASDLGTTGVRDPYLVRAPGGDKFYLFATDLRIFGGDNAGWDIWQRQGSRSLVVWESTDLVNWSEPRLVQVSPEGAGMTWAPEAIWDETRGEFVVFWASKLYDQASDPNHAASTYSKILYATTRDFVTFSPAAVYLDTGADVIDTTMYQYGGRTYRISKDNGSGRGVYMEVGSSIFATDFRIIATNIGQARYGSVEAPLIFKDTQKAQWYLLVDQYGAGGQGYKPFTTTDLDSGVWTPLSGAQYSQAPNTKHGVVLPLVGSEWERLSGTTVTSAVPIAVSTRLGTAPALPATASVQLSNGATQTRSVAWDAVPAASYAVKGSFTVRGDVLGTTVDAVTTVAVTSDDTTAPTVGIVVAPTSPDGADGWYRNPVAVSVGGADNSGVAPVLEMRTGDGGYAPVTGPVTVTTEGTTVLTARATDNSGNVSAAATATIKLDRTAPTVTGAVTGRTVTVTGADTTSGIASVEVRVDGGAWAAYGAPVVVDEAAHEVAYRATDRAGLVSGIGSVTLPAVVAGDKAALTLTSNATPSAEGWYNQLVLVSVAAPTGTRAQYRINNGAWNTYSRAFTVSTTGTNTVETRLLRNAVVVAGSGSAVPVRIDTRLPVSTATRSPGTGAGSPRNPVTVTFAGTDTGSGLARTEYTVDGGPWVTASGPLVVDVVGTHLIGYRSVDVAGNTENARSITVSITADRATTIKPVSSRIAAGSFATFTLAGYLRYDTVRVSLGGVVLGSVGTDVNGTARVTLQVPASAPAGRLTVTAAGIAGPTADASVTVSR